MSGRCLCPWGCLDFWWGTGWRGLGVREWDCRCRGRYGGGRLHHRRSRIDGLEFLRNRLAHCTGGVDGGLPTSFFSTAIDIWMIAFLCRCGTCRVGRIRRCRAQRVSHQLQRIAVGGSSKVTRLRKRSAAAQDDGGCLAAWFGLGEGSPGPSQMLDVLHYQCGPSKVSVPAESTKRRDQFGLRPARQRGTIQIEHGSRKSEAHCLSEQ